MSVIQHSSLHRQLLHIYLHWEIKCEWNRVKNVRWIYLADILNFGWPWLAGKLKLQKKYLKSLSLYINSSVFSRIQSCFTRKPYFSIRIFHGFNLVLPVNRIFQSVFFNPYFQSVFFNPYFSIRIFQSVFFNPYFSRIQSCFTRKPYFSIRIFQSVYFNPYISIRIFQSVYFNPYISIRIFQSVFFNPYFSIRIFHEFNLVLPVNRIFQSVFFNPYFSRIQSYFTRKLSFIL